MLETERTDTGQAKKTLAFKRFRASNNRWAALRCSQQYFISSRYDQFHKRLLRNIHCETQ